MKKCSYISAEQQIKELKEKTCHAENENKTLLEDLETYKRVNTPIIKQLQADLFQAEQQIKGLKEALMAADDRLGLFETKNKH